MDKERMIDQETCLGCGACKVGIFDYDKEWAAFVILDENAGTAEVFDELFENAPEGCPTESIKAETPPFKNFRGNRLDEFR
nr:ferredoxin [Peribacillus muralis]